MLITHVKTQDSLSHGEVHIRAVTPFPLYHLNLAHPFTSTMPLLSHRHFKVDCILRL